MKTKKYAEIDWTAEPSDDEERAVRVAYLRSLGMLGVQRMILLMDRDDQDPASDLWDWLDEIKEGLDDERETEERYRLACAVADTLGTPRPAPTPQRPHMDALHDLLGAPSAATNPSPRTGHAQPAGSRAYPSSMNVEQDRRHDALQHPRRLPDDLQKATACDPVRPCVAG